MTAKDLLGAARYLTKHGATGVWPRASALLARQSLEAALEGFWKARRPEVAAVSTRAQLACLREYGPDPAFAGDVAFAWSRLSTLCHHHPYELAPTEPELRALFDDTERMVDRLAAASGQAPAAGPA